MNGFQDIIALAYDLKTTLEQEPCVVRLESLNQALNKEQELLRLSEEFHALQLDYERLWELYGDEHPQLLSVQKKLHQLKLTIDTHPLVKTYLEAYRDVRHLYQRLQKDLFTPFHTPIKGCL